MELFSLKQQNIEDTGTGTATEIFTADVEFSFGREGYDDNDDEDDDDDDADVEADDVLRLEDEACDIVIRRLKIKLAFL